MATKENRKVPRLARCASADVARRTDDNSVGTVSYAAAPFPNDWIAFSSLS